MELKEAEAKARFLKEVLVKGWSSGFLARTTKPSVEK